MVVLLDGSQEVRVELYQTHPALDRITTGTLLSFCKHISNWIRSKRAKSIIVFPTIVIMRKIPALMMLTSLYTDRIMEWDSTERSFVDLISQNANVDMDEIKDVLYDKTEFPSESDELRKSPILL
uniref:Uncharacterized protein n=1 Tax=Acrobeloides nanus TaxID=290746 RepID=A0A914DGG4_9BILA